MKNYILFLLKSKLNVNIKGPNIEKFIKRLKNNNIEILNINYVSKNEINIKIYESDYDKVMSLKTIYEIDILDYFGIIRFKNNLLSNKFVITMVFVALLFLYIVTNIIFSIDIITNDSKMENLLKEELSEFGIKKYNFKKSYNDIQKIKQEILSKYRSEIDWIEIESIGTKYIVRYEPRIESIENIDTPLRHIIAKKDCIIKNLDISSGQIIKGINSYVKKGDIIVSGYIDLNGSVKDTVSSIGTVYGEVWYKVEITYPFTYYESFETGKENKVIVVKFLNKNIELFNFNKYKTKNIEEKTILKNNILPIKLVYQVQRETNVINEKLNEEELIKKASKKALEKIEAKLKDNEYVSDYKVLSKSVHDESVTLNIFFSVVEDVTDYKNIEEYKEEIENSG